MLYPHRSDSLCEYLAQAVGDVRVERHQSQFVRSRLRVIVNMMNLEMTILPGGEGGARKTVARLAKTSGIHDVFVIEKADRRDMGVPQKNHIGIHTLELGA